MKLYKQIALITVVILSINGNCERYEHQHNLIIQNDSDKELICVASDYGSLLVDTTAFPNRLDKCYTRLEYLDFIDDFLIKPHSNKKLGIDHMVDYLQTHLEAKLSVGVYYRSDIDSMTNKEFLRLYPIKKCWDLTLEDLEECNWTLLYSE